MSAPHCLPTKPTLSPYIRDPFVRRAFKRAEKKGSGISPRLPAGTRIICVDNFTPGPEGLALSLDGLRLDAIYTVRDFYWSPDYNVICVRVNEITREFDDGDIEEIGYLRWRFRVLADRPKRAERKRTKAAGGGPLSCQPQRVEMADA